MSNSSKNCSRQRRYPLCMLQTLGWSNLSKSCSQQRRLAQFGSQMQDDAGMLRVIREPQPSKVPSRISVTPFGMSKLDKERQPAQALRPMLITDSGRDVQAPQRAATRKCGSRAAANKGPPSNGYHTPWNAQVRQGTAAIKGALSDFSHSIGDCQTS